MPKYTNEYQVLTASGFQDFEGIKESTRQNNIKIIFDDSSIVVTPEHLFYVGKSNRKIFRKAHKIKIGHKINNKKVKDKILNIECSDKFYDLINVKNGNHYITSDVTSHNCAFIKPSLWEEFSDSIFPSQSGLAWKKTILISTANGKNHFYNIIKGARANTNGYTNYEVPWEKVPRYNSDGTKKTPEEFKNEIISKYGIVYFEQNYGGNFSGSSHTLVSSDKLDELIPSEPELILDGKLKIYKKPIKGHQYIMSIDPAKDGKDAFAIQVMDITNFSFEQVATAQLQIDYLLMPEYISEWCSYYFNPYLIIENNEGAGQSIADQMYQTYEYENLHFDKVPGSNKKKKYPGTRTTTKSRKQILQTMKTFIENDKLKIYDDKTIQEFSTFILVNNKYQADDGTHDDMIMSLALSFTLFNDSKNFEDMKKVTELLFQDITEENIDISEILTIGSFDDGVALNEEISRQSSTYINYEDYLSDIEGFI